MDAIAKTEAEPVSEKPAAPLPEKDDLNEAVPAEPSADKDEADKKAD